MSCFVVFSQRTNEKLAKKSITNNVGDPLTAPCKTLEKKACGNRFQVNKNIDKSVVNSWHTYFIVKIEPEPTVRTSAILLWSSAANTETFLGHFRTPL